MTSEEACQQFIDARIRPDLQEHYPQLVACYREAWKAAVKWSKEQ